MMRGASSPSDGCEGHGLPRGVVRQAQDHHVGFRHQRLARSRILTQLRRNALDREARLMLQPLSGSRAPSSPPLRR